MDMSGFPKKEAEVVALAELIISNLTAHVADFPSVDFTSLRTALNDYKNYKQSREGGSPDTVTKDDEIEALVDIMENNIKLMLPAILKKITAGRLNLDMESQLIEL
jgi:hypothetical protein